LNNWNNNSGYLDDKSDASIDIVNTDVKTLDSQSSGMVLDGTWSHDEYDGTAQPGLKRRCKPSSIVKDFQCLLKTVQYALCRKQQIHAKIPFPISKIEQYWSAEFANSPIPDPYNAQKPDVALFYYKSKTSEKTWTDILSFVEHTTSDVNKRCELGVYWGSATKAYLIM
jgi:hypothetical protein